MDQEPHDEVLQSQNELRMCEIESDFTLFIYLLFSNLTNTFIQSDLDILFFTHYFCHISGTMGPLF